MNTTQFYITLPSNSSTQYYPHNAVSHYTTQLPKRIDLMGSWEVALIEIHYPGNFENVTENGNYVLIQANNAGTECKIPPGLYESIDTLLSHVNICIESVGMFKYDKEHSSIKLLIDDILRQSTKIKLSDTLALQLGYNPTVDIVKHPHASKPPDVMRGVPNSMFVYCDVVEPQLVGDVVTPLLRVVNTRADKTQYGRSFTQIFQSPMYVPVLKRQFNDIEINLRDSAGHFVPFGFGLSSVVLHFRRCTN